eukprot:983715_1
MEDDSDSKEAVSGIRQRKPSARVLPNTGARQKGNERTSDSITNERKSDSSDEFSTRNSPRTPRKSEQKDHDGTCLVGIQEDGRTFPVPQTRSVIANFLTPKLWSLPAIVVLLGLGWQFYVVLFWGLSRWAHVAMFFFWRLCYNIGLGYILTAQSRRQWFTRHIHRLTSNSRSFSARFIYWLTSSNMGSDYHAPSAPSCFVSWLCFRWLADIVLINDAFQLFFLFLKCFTVPQSFWLGLIRYSVGLSLAVLNYYVKTDAHRQIGDYSWYWGDFFFVVKRNLTFDGVFQYFPHPMYTVGYSLYYGTALVSSSYLLFFCTLGAHLMQLSFLVIVENPHIEKLYGSDTHVDSQTKNILYDPRRGFFPSGKDAVTFYQLDLCRSSDLGLVLFTVYAATFSFLVSDPFWCVVQVILWRVLHWTFVGGVLYCQSKYKSWTHHFSNSGRSLQDAFNHWKNTYNLSLTMNVVVFTCCAMRFVSIPEEGISSKFILCIVLGLLLIALSVYSSHSAYKAVGDFGWFYGDFFIPTKKYQTQLCYSGIYRYLNNPDCVTGYAALYGMALISQNMTMLGLAFMAQMMNVVFVMTVEVPHMHRLYTSGVRTDSPLPKAVKKFIADKTEIGSPKAIMNEIFGLYEQFSNRRKSIPRGERGPQLEYNPEVTVGDPLSVRVSGDFSRRSDDWIGVYPIHMPSMPGLSRGKWRLGPEEFPGEITFPTDKLPSDPGVYELRYHIGGTYTVIAAGPIIFKISE